MKKLLPIVGSFCITITAYAQSPRLVCFEEFTGQNCNPCAATNPALNTLLNANNTKVVSIKYMSPHGSSAPASFYLNNKAEVDARSTYYGNQVAPHGYLDGANSLLTNTDASDGPYGDHPTNLKQAMIDNEFALTSPFNVTVTHTITPNYDSIYIKLVIKATQSVTGNFKARVAVIERELNFTTAPGLNGELKYEGMMKKMLPNATGSTLPAAYAVGDSTVLNLSWKFGTYMNDFGQVAVVAFIQNDSSKYIFQAGYSPAIPVTFPDAGMSTITSVPVYQCGVTSITPSAVLKNLSNTTMTSAKIHSKIDSGVPDTLNWTGSLAPSATTTIALNPIAVTPGAHTLTVYNSTANGTTDYNSLNSSVTKKFTIAGTPVAAPFVEGYTTTTFPPAGWAVDNKGNDAATWVRKTGAGGFGTSTACAKMDIYNSLAGQEDDFIAPPVNLSNIPAPVNLTFSVAYAQYTAGAPENDKLEILVTSNCGTTWTSVFTKIGDNLKTASPTTTSFTPTAAQWRAESVNLDAFAGQGSVIVKFHILSDYGNNLYIDDVNLSGATGIIYSFDDDEAITLYPNPSTGIISLNSISVDTKKVIVYNTLGEIVAEFNKHNSVGNFSIDLSGQPEGIYALKIVSDNNTVVKKAIISK